jgi:hypothetical protein
MKKVTNLKVLVLAVLLSIFSIMPIAYGVDFDIYQLTDNSVEDKRPNVYFDGVELEITWMHYYSVLSDYYIAYYYYNFSNYDTDSYLVGYSGGNASPVVNDGYITWRTMDVDEIYQYDSINGYSYIADGSEPVYDGITFSFARGLNPRNIYYTTDGVSINLISTNSYKNQQPSHDNGLYAWMGHWDNTYTSPNWIYYWNGSGSPQYIKNYGSNFQVDSYAPSVHNGKIAWYKKVNDQAQEHDIFLWEGGTSYNYTRITNRPNYDDKNPSLYNGNIAWQGIDENGTDYEIFYFDGTSIQQVTDNNYDDINPSLYNGILVWQTDGPYSEIYIAIPQP